METSGITSKKKFKSQPSARKVLTIFWDLQRVIPEHYLESGTTVNSVGYSEMQSTELKPVIRTKRRGLLSSDVLLLITTRAHILPSTLFKLL